MENVIRELDLKNFEDDFNKEEKNLVAQRAVLKNGIVNSAIDEKTQRKGSTLSLLMSTAEMLPISVLLDVAGCLRVSMSSALFLGRN